MVQFVNLAQAVMRKGAHSHLLFSYSKFLTWVRIVGIAKEQLDVYEAVSTKKTRQLEVFRWEKKELVFVQVLGTYNSDPSIKSLEHMSFLDSAVQFCMKGLTIAEILKQVYYQADGRVPSSLPG